MANSVRILPAGLANQIAAGEVVERPASVVKELVENALDAGSREVRVETAEGGRKLIRVIDDGEGMSPADARLAFERHATSKIHTQADLERVATYGFRGEALPSIASVARVRLVTKRAEDAAATEIRIGGGVLENQSETGGPPGTLVEVEDLFFNTPARRKFLKRPAVETARVTESMERLALARPDVGFNLLQGGRTVLDARAGVPLEERIAEVLGGADGSGLLPVHLRTGSVALEGFLSPPDRSHPTARGIYLAVNGRPIRDRALQHAVVAAARDFIPQNRFPLAVLLLRLPPGTVDENVHPAKLEVRFREGRRVYDAVRRALLDALRGFAPLEGRLPQPAPIAGTAGVQEALADYAAGASAIGESGGTLEPAGGAIAPPAVSEGGGFRPAPRFLGQAHETYLLFETAGGLLVLDQHAAHERLIFERLLAEAESGGIARQPLLVPRTIALAAGRRARLEGAREAIAKLGFELEPFGGDTLAVKCVPAALAQADLAALLLEVADDLPEDGEGDESADRLSRAFRRALATVACHAAVRAGQRLSREQADGLAQAIEAASGTATCPHGRPVAIRLARSDLERRFGRS